VGITGQQMTAMVRQIIRAKEIAGFYRSRQCWYIGVLLISNQGVLQKQPFVENTGSAAPMENSNVKYRHC